MNGAQLHLLLNHFPLFLVTTGIVLLWVSFLGKKPQLEKTAAWIFVAAGAACIATYFSGLEAEKVIKNYPVATENFIAVHASRALQTSYAIALLTLTSCVTLIAGSVKKYFTALRVVLLVLSSLCLALIVQTSHLGGLIAHEEIRTDEFSHGP